ncbi:MAG: YfhO family protein [Bacteroidales bacterium]|nr:YfhO family protein [Bacteroidales bacterium]
MENYKDIFKKALPFLVAIVFFIALSFIYFNPVLEGKVLPQMDNIHAKGISHELAQYHDETGRYSQWTNSMFGGMPAYQIYIGETNNIYLYIQRFLRLGLPYTTVAILFIYMFGFYLLLLSLRFNHWQSILGGMAFGLASYNIIIIAAGHITKTYAIAYMAPVIAGVLMAYRGKYLWGGIITAFALGVEISTNHIQIIYYLALMIVLLILTQFVYAIIEKKFKDFFKASVVLAVAAVLAILPNITGLATTYEYGKESIRGKSELTDNMHNKSSGLDKDYALAWSYGKDETLTLLIPNAKGGASAPIGANMDVLEDVNPQFVEYVAKSSSYFGNQPFTSGPVYLGAILIFLFVFGLFTIKGSVKWWLFAAALLGILLSWGKNLEWFTDIFYYYVPMYNKFRTVSMALVITSFAVPLLAMMVLKEVMDDRGFIAKNKKWFYISLGITAGLSLIFYLIPDAFFNFLSNAEIARFDAQKSESAQAAQQLNLYIEGLKSARMNIFKADAIRSSFFIILAAAALWGYSSVKAIKETHLLAALAILILADMWTVDKRYLNEDMFRKKSFVRNEFPKTPADEVILKDADPDFRVLSYLHSPINDGYTPYYHKSIGGYHGAKLRRYQDIIDRYLGFEVQAVAQARQSDTTGNLAGLFSKTNIINMLNTKYVIFSPKEVELNWQALGHAWFVDDYELVNNADEEIAALATFNPAKTAIIDKRFENQVKDLPKEFFSLDTGYIELVKYEPNYLKYKAYTPKKRLAVFSEIYYDKGWNAFIDGFPVDHLRVNYILRALVIPEGVHEIEFRFEPKTYHISKNIAMGSSILVVLLLLAIVGLSFKKAKPEKNKDE